MTSVSLLCLLGRSPRNSESCWHLSETRRLGTVTVQTFTVTSEHIRFYFLVFFCFLFRFFSVGFRAHVKIASRIVSYRKPPGTIARESLYDECHTERVVRDPLQHCSRDNDREMSVKVGHEMSAKIDPVTDVTGVR